MTRQELIKLQRTRCPYSQFPQSLLQYLGTFSRDTTGQHLGPSNGNITRRWDMNNMQLAIPDAWIRSR